MRAPSPSTWFQFIPNLLADLPAQIGLKRLRPVGMMRDMSGIIATAAAVPLPSGTFGKVQKGRPATGGTGSRGPRVGSGTG